MGRNIPYVPALLDHAGVKIRAKALSLLGGMGLEHPLKAKDAVPAIASFCGSVELLRERTENALGRIGRADFRLIELRGQVCFISQPMKKPRGG